MEEDGGNGGDGGEKRKRLFKIKLCEINWAEGKTEKTEDGVSLGVRYAKPSKMEAKRK